MSLYSSPSRNPNPVVLQAGKLYRVPPDRYGGCTHSPPDWDELDSDNLVFVCSVVELKQLFQLKQTNEVVLIDSRGVVWKGDMDVGSYYHKRFWEIEP